jgi:hypothetical protein
LGTGVTRPFEGQLTEILAIVQEEIAARLSAEAGLESAAPLGIPRFPIMEAYSLGMPAPRPSPLPPDDLEPFDEDNDEDDGSGAEIGSEVHKLDQFFRVEEGTGEAILDGVRTAIRAGFAVVVPAGATHNIVNTGSLPLKLYTLYAPPNHRDGVVHHTRADAEADTEQFDGKTSE